MKTVPVRYSRLSRNAREVIKYWYGDPVTIAGYVRYRFPDGVWRGDSCGCPDDRCIGYHHDEDEDCGCLPVTLGEYTQAVTAVRPPPSAEVLTYR
jgi:hypothetical protein